MIFNHGLTQMKTDANQIAARFKNESECVRQIVSERGKFWACRLAINLLDSHLQPINKLFAELQNGHSYKRSKQVSEKETIGWLICKIQDLQNLITHFQGLVCNDLILSLNSAPSEDSVSAVGILDAVERISAASHELILWEEEIRFTILPEKIRAVQESLRGATAQILNELNVLAGRIEAPLKKAKSGGVYKLKINFQEPPQIAKFNKQLSKLMAAVQKNPQDWVGWA